MIDWICKHKIYKFLILYEFIHKDKFTKNYYILNKFVWFIYMLKYDSDHILIQSQILAKRLSVLLWCIWLLLRSLETPITTASTATEMIVPINGIRRCMWILVMSFHVFSDAVLIICNEQLIASCSICGFNFKHLKKPFILQPLFSLSRIPIYHFSNTCIVW